MPFKKNQTSLNLTKIKIMIVPVTSVV